MHRLFCPIHLVGQNLFILNKLDYFSYFGSFICLCYIGRAIKTNGMVLDNTWVFIPRKVQWHIHTGLWSLVNCQVRSAYKTLYKVVMNINEVAVGLEEWPRP